MASRTEFLLWGLSSTVSPTYACKNVSQVNWKLFTFFENQEQLNLSFDAIQNLCNYKSDLHIQNLISDSDNQWSAMIKVNISINSPNCQLWLAAAINISTSTITVLNEIQVSNAQRFSWDLPCLYMMYKYRYIRCASIDIYLMNKNRNIYRMSNKYKYISDEAQFRVAAFPSWVFHLSFGIFNKEPWSLLKILFFGIRNICSQA